MNKLEGIKYYLLRIIAVKMLTAIVVYKVASHPGDQSKPLWLANGLAFAIVVHNQNVLASVNLGF